MARLRRQGTWRIKSVPLFLLKHESMAFITFNMIFVEDDDILGKSKGEEAEITVNTNLICAYNEGSDPETTMLRMANGEVYPCPMSRQEFEKFISTVDNVIAIKEISEN